MSIRIVLVETSHPGNIGAAARAMKNMGLTELVLVRPRYFPHPDARARASGAHDVLERARVVERFADAVGDCVLVMGTSARSRAMPWPRLHAREAAAKALSLAAAGNVALVFGPENNGLCSRHLDRCQLLVSIPSDPAFSSLNLGMAVQVMAYELRAASRCRLSRPKRRRLRRRRSSTSTPSSKRCSSSLAFSTPTIRAI